MDDAELKVGGYTFKAQHLLFAAPLVSALAGGIYYSYDAYQRFLGVEEGFEEVQGALGSIQALEQTVGDNDVANLSAQLTAISTNMETILEQQKTLLDLRSKVEKSETITNGLGDKLDKYDREFDDLWDAMDELYANPLK
mgnify:FL=1